jgi:hypothetical protein
MSLPPVTSAQFLISVMLVNLPQGGKSICDISAILLGIKLEWYVCINLMDNDNYK